jgi:nickel/cobalt exporter
MAETDLIALCITAAMLGLVHTLLGPDHYVPFIAMSKVGRWSLRKTTAITALCGVGHVASSIIIGALGIALGWAVGGVEAFEGGRGGLAGWLLLGFGLAYMAWGIHRAARHRTRGHVHVIPDGSAHYHGHEHAGEHTHAGVAQTGAGSMTPWILFTIFVFGPCEPLIPILMYPAAKQNMAGVALVTTVFALFTIGTMLAVVIIGSLGLAQLEWHALGRYAHALAGLIIAACGAAIKLGL